MSFEYTTTKITDPDSLAYLANIPDSIKSFRLGNSYYDYHEGIWYRTSRKWNELTEEKIVPRK